MRLDEIVETLRANANPRNVEGMARYGISSKNTLGISVWKIREIAKEIGKDHPLALHLWKTEIHEARLLAAFVDEPKQITESQMESWAMDFESWDVCDQVTTSLFDQTPHSYKKVRDWSSRKEEFVKRAAFSMIAGLAVHDKKADDETFVRLLPLIVKASTDERNYVRKAVNWALRNIGKRNLALNKAAIGAARIILALDTKSSRWIARDALRELEGEKVQAMLAKKAGHLRAKRAAKKAQRANAKSVPIKARELRTKDQRLRARSRPKAKRT